MTFNVISLVSVLLSSSMFQITRRKNLIGLASVRFFTPDLSIIYPWIYLIYYHITCAWHSVSAHLISNQWPPSWINELAMVRRQGQLIQTWPMGAHFRVCDPFPMVVNEASTSGDNLYTCSPASLWSIFPLISAVFGLLSSSNLFPNSDSLHMLFTMPDMFFTVLVADWLTLSYKFIFFASFLKIYRGLLNIFFLRQ